MSPAFVSQLKEKLRPHLSDLLAGKEAGGILSFADRQTLQEKLELLANKTLSPAWRKDLTHTQRESLVRELLDEIISGPASSGKTTLTNALAATIPTSERIVLIEDPAELRLPDHHSVRLEARPPNIEGRGEITIRHLVKRALHMCPDRIIVSEVLSAETLDMLQAMNRGHDGSLTTLHANSPAIPLTVLRPWP